MAFHTLVSGQRVIPDALILLPQLKTALTQRQAALGKTVSTFPALSGLLSGDTFIGATWRNTLRTGIEGLISDSSNCFLKSDGVTPYSSLADLLQTAGYASGEWDTDTVVSNRVTWQQMVACFGILKKYKTTRFGSYSYDQLNFHKYGESDFAQQDAWDAALAAAPGTTPIPNYSGGTFGLYSARFQLWGWGFAGPGDEKVASIIDAVSIASFGGGCIGTMSKLTTSFDVIASVTAGGGFSLEYELASDGSLIDTGALYTIPDGATSENRYRRFDFSWTGSAAIANGLTFKFWRATSPPALAPFNTGFGFNNLGWQIWADATSALTYG